LFEGLKGTLLLIIRSDHKFADTDYSSWAHDQKLAFQQGSLVVFKIVKKEFNPNAHTLSDLKNYLESTECYSYWMADRYALLLAAKVARKSKFEMRIVKLALLCYIVMFLGVWTATIVASRPKTDIAFLLINSGVVAIVKIFFCFHTAAIRVRDGTQDNIVKLNAALQTLRTATTNLGDIQNTIDQNTKREVDFWIEFWNSLSTMSIAPIS